MEVNTKEEYEKELNPCPFCGHNEIKLHGVTNFVFGQCCDCLASSGTSRGYETAVANWNKRIN